MQNYAFNFLLSFASYNIVVVSLAKVTAAAGVFRVHFKPTSPSL